MALVSISEFQELGVVETTTTTRCAATPEPQWVTDIKAKINSLAEKKEINTEEYVRILFFLDQEGFESSYMSSLKLIKDSDKHFKTYLMRLVEDTRKAERDPH